MTKDIQDLDEYDCSLQIILKMDFLLDELKKQYLGESKLISKLNEVIKNKNDRYQRIKFINLFLNENNLNCNKENDSQLFIIELITKIFGSKEDNLISNINNNPTDNSFIKSFNKKLESKFTIIIKNILNCKCHNFESIYEIKIEDKINENITFSELLDKFLDKKFNKKTKINCKNCWKETTIIKKTIVYLPEILIFTLKDIKYRGYITPDEIELKKYIDESYIKNGNNAKYYLFAVNCHYDKENKSNTGFNGLFYRKKYEIKQKEDEDEIIDNNNDVYENDIICGIENVGNNCYLNSGIQIILRCKPFLDEVQKIDNKKFSFVYKFKEVLLNLQTNAKYNPSKFIKYFCDKNENYLEGAQCCSQSFIRTLINNINKDIIEENEQKYIISSKDIEYKAGSSDEKIAFEKYIKKYKIFPQSKALNIISGIAISITNETCDSCYCKYYKESKDYSFEDFIDFHIYLDKINNKSKFQEILYENIGKKKKIKVDCSICENNFSSYEETTFIKVPKILIFTLERYLNRKNEVSIIPDKILDITKYVHKSLKKNNEKYEYELFAINIRLGKTDNFGHEKCLVKLKNIWYEIDDEKYFRIDNLENYYRDSYGLFYIKKDN